jgi:hypothetical protein
MSKQLTAIAYAAKKIKADIHIYGGEGWDVMEEVLIILNEALEMEQDQIEDAYDMGYLDYQNLTCDSAQEYYNGIYGQQVITITTQPDNHDTTESNT